MARRSARARRRRGPEPTRLPPRSGAAGGGDHRGDGPDHRGAVKRDGIVVHRQRCAAEHVTPHAESRSPRRSARCSTCAAVAPLSAAPSLPERPRSDASTSRSAPSRGRGRSPARAAGNAKLREVLAGRSRSGGRPLGRSRSGFLRMCAAHGIAAAGQRPHGRVDAGLLLAATWRLVVETDSFAFHSTAWRAPRREGRGVPGSRLDGSALNVGGRWCGTAAARTRFAAATSVGVDGRVEATGRGDEAERA